MAADREAIWSAAQRAGGDAAAAEALAVIIAKVLDTSLAEVAEGLPQSREYAARRGDDLQMRKSDQSLRLSARPAVTISRWRPPLCHGGSTTRTEGADMNRSAGGSLWKPGRGMSVGGFPMFSRLVAGFVAVGLGLTGPCLGASSATSIDVSTPGGAVIGSRVIRVTSLADSGPGSLREALAATEPRVVVFDVAGYIELNSNLRIDNGQVTVAGQTAPDPGVVLRGASLTIRASDVVIEHLAVYAGSTADPKRAANRDSITIYGRASHEAWVKNVVLRNVSVGWGVDENIGINGLVDGVRIERSLIAEGLRKGGMKDVHSYNLLTGSPVRTLLILGNVFAASNQRSPRVTQGNIVEFLNNFVYGFGEKATHIDSNKKMSGAARIDVIGNLYRRTPDSRCDKVIIQISKTFFDSVPPSQVHLADNTESSPAIENCRSSDQNDAGIAQRLSTQSLATVPSWRIVPSSSLYPGILDLVGSHPADRNPIDARIVEGIRDGTTRIIDSERDVGGWPAIEAKSVRSALPIEKQKIGDAKDLSVLTTWLCEQSAQAAGRGSERIGCQGQDFKRPGHAGVPRGQLDESQ